MTDPRVLIGHVSALRLTPSGAEVALHVELTTLEVLDGLRLGEAVRVVIEKAPTPEPPTVPVKGKG